MQVKTILVALIAAVGLLFAAACSEPDQPGEIEMPARPGEMPRGYEQPSGSMPEADPGQGTEPGTQPEQNFGDESPRSMEQPLQRDAPPEGVQ